MPAFSLRLFGSFEVKVNGEPLPRLRSRKGQWLLALLALRPGSPVERAWLAGTLWPEAAEENALVSLRQTLTDLRRALGSESDRIHSPTTRTLAFDAANASVDVLAFDAALRQGDNASLERAVALQERPLLEDCLEEWALPEREMRCQSCLAARQTLAAAAMASGEFAAAAVHLRCVVAGDPFHEVAQRDLMTALARNGDWGAMLHTYRDLRLLLQRELRAEPASETRALYRQLRTEAREEATASPHVSPDTAQGANAGRLPRPLTELVGREQEVIAVSALLYQSRLVTLMGPGGVGKTRLAIRVAESWAEDQPDGVWFVDLAPLTDPALVAHSVAAALGVHEEASRTLPDTLVAALGDRRLILILDNCEHLLQACAELASCLLERCPALCLLTTSRQALGLTGETVWPVPSLSVPSLKDSRTADAVARTDAVRLFVDRAASVLSGFTLTAGNAPAIAQICRRLDGIPLAVELAAARVRMLSPEQIAARLDDRFRLLTQGSRTALPRQQTLRAAVDWSYDLLSEPERRLLACLSVFAGGWTLEAAEAVCVPEDAAGADILDLLTALEEKSLVAVELSDGPERRYYLLETFRQYAAERLAESGRAADLSRRHREWAMTLVDAAETHCRGPEATAWLNRLEADHDNLRAALAQCRTDSSGGAEAGLHLAAGLWRFWMDHGHYREGLGHLTDALARGGGVAAAPEVLHSKALNGAAALAWHQGDVSLARTYMEKALTLARRSGDQSCLVSCLNNLGAVVYKQSDYAATRSLWEECLLIRRSMTRQDGVGSSLNNLGSLAYAEGKFPQARALHTEAMEIAQSREDQHCRQSALFGLGHVAWSEGDLAAACAYFEEGLALARKMGDTDGVAGGCIALGWAALSESRAGQASAMLRTGLEIARHASLMPLVLDAIDGLSELAFACGRAGRSACLAGAGEQQRSVRSLPRTLIFQERFAAHRERLQKHLGSEAFAASWNQGKCLTPDQAIDLAGPESAADGADR